MVTAGSVTALFLRGFRIKTFTQELKNKSVITPSIDCWLVETTGYDSKMDAYKAGVVGTADGLGVYILPDDSAWVWVSGVYPTEQEAQDALNNYVLLSNAQVRLYSIKGKKFSLDAEAATQCQLVLDAIQDVYQLLIEIRSAMLKSESISSLQIEITNQYNQVKNAGETLQTINATLHSDFIATVIYTINQNILGLQKVISSNESVNLDDVNSALLKTIFSLDNF